MVKPFVDGQESVAASYVTLEIHRKSRHRIYSYHLQWYAFDHLGRSYYSIS